MPGQITAVREALYTRPWLYPKQEAALFDPARFSCIEASTKSGKTVGAIVWLAEQAMTERAVTHPNYWWAAPIYPQADIAFRRMKAAFPQGMIEANLGKMTLSLPNGATIWFKSGENPDSLFGEDVWAVVIDEASRVKEESWHAIRTTLSATEGPARIIGNVRGRRNWAWRLCREAEKGAPGLAYHRITAYDAIQAGVLSAEEVEEARHLLPEAVFEELYMAQATETGANPFGGEHISACTGAMSADAPVMWGWDLAKSVDWTVGIALDARRRACRFMRFQRPWKETMDAIRQETGRVRAIVDSTGVGDPVVEALQRGGGMHVEGYHMTQSSKQQLMEGLAVAIQHRLILFPAGPIPQELEAFEYTYSQRGVSYSAPEGMHDDCVIALGLCNWGLNQGGGLGSPPSKRTNIF